MSHTCQVMTAVWDETYLMLYLSDLGFPFGDTESPLCCVIDCTLVAIICCHRRPLLQSFLATLLLKAAGSVSQHCSIFVIQKRSGQQRRES